jgi:hypothetical protein
MSKELAADYFSRHLSSNECHITSDGRVFHSKGTAEGFANGLKDNKVSTYNRSEVEDPKSETSSGDDSTIKIQALELLKSFDAVSATYPEIKALVKDLGLQSPTQGKEDLLATIEAFKVACNTVVEE